jgi:hypothetical protein
MRSDLFLSRSFLALLFTGMLFALVQSGAAAQYNGPPSDATRVYGGLWLGFGGDAELDGDGAFGGSLRTTVGGQFGLDVIGPRFFTLGAEVRVGAAKWKMGERTKLLDFALKPRLRLAFDDVPLELYAAVPIGITVPRLANAYEESEGSVGWNLGAGGGVNLFFTEDFGVNVEPMWLMHTFKLDGDDLKLRQFAMFVNVVLAL